VKEGAHLAKSYDNKSIAEQNSMDLAWELLTDSSYEDLLATICGSATELKRFRQLIVHSIMATDVFEKDLKALRESRWEQAFSKTTPMKDRSSENDLKATIVIEYLIQASDVSHTMQHWQIYRKWNECLFKEMYKAFCEGRAEKDPASFWYEGEMKFFDFYILPLAQKLKQSGVFGASSDECLDYATKNREEWKTRGEEVIIEMLAGFNADAERGIIKVAGDRMPPALAKKRPSGPSKSSPPAAPKNGAMMDSLIQSLMQQAQKVENDEKKLSQSRRGSPDGENLAPSRSMDDAIGQLMQQSLRAMALDQAAMQQKQQQQPYHGGNDAVDEEDEDDIASEQSRSDAHQS